MGPGALLHHVVQIAMSTFPSLLQPGVASVEKSFGYYRNSRAPPSPRAVQDPWDHPRARRHSGPHRTSRLSTREFLPQSRGNRQGLMENCLLRQPTRSLQLLVRRHVSAVRPRTVICWIRFRLPPLLAAYSHCASVGRSIGKPACLPIHWQ